MVKPSRSLFQDHQWVEPNLDRRTSTASRHRTAVLSRVYPENQLQIERNNTLEVHHDGMGYICHIIAPAQKIHCYSLRLTARVHSGDEDS